MSLLILVGSTNPAKTDAVKHVCEQAFPGCGVRGIDVPSGVRAQPIGEPETALGARNRARAALASDPEARMALGLEGGLSEAGELINCVVLVARDGRENVTWGVRFPLPPAIAARSLGGEELGTVMDEVSGLTGSKRKLGAVGILTQGLYTRAEMWKGPVACVLMPWLHPELYGVPAAPGDGSRTA
ncbi:inosine/xanthosine triphosphatase [Archangium primigenium]|uniref:inosine/xanthosine triphosphatase n=1 Tax=[Archangium] primigenium TaxID=2792470 RepID=UPI00195B59B2|nr:inosine/xanthosine triphosphatase [Archangium primigenium]MBM7114774.1 inosine/xanthosine triphosphatase [Archangium primigenium]